MIRINIGLLLVWLGCCRSELTLFPVGRELQYHWKANVSTGTILPSIVVDSWAVDAQVTIQQQSDNATFFKIDNVILSPTDNESVDISSLSLPFKVTYQNGELVGLKISEQDEIWSRNIKRALAAALQIKLTSIMISSFIVTEINHFGKCAVEYEIVELTNVTLSVRKTIDHDSCENLPFVHFANCAISMCPGAYQSMAATDSEREYILTPYEEVLLRNMTATGRMLVQPYQANAESHYSKISQTFNFVKMDPIEKKKEIQLPSDGISIELIYETVKLDPTYGKKPNNNSAVVSEIFKQLGELSDSLSSWEVGVKGLDNETSFHVLDLMLWLRVEDWESLHNAISLGTSYRQETIQNLFWDLLPHVGSRSAVLFIKKLITTGKIKGFLASRMLAYIPFHLREHSEELLAECEDFLSFQNRVSKDVQNAAILSFASMISKTCKTECKMDTIDRYAKLYLDKFTESSSHEDAMIYLQGLSNMELNQVLNFLTPVIVGQTKMSKHIRFLAVWATMHTVYTNPVKIYEVYWPLFINKTESLEVRIASLSLLIMSKPSTARFFSIYLHMQEEPSEQLYNFYYTTIHSMSKTNYPCYRSLRQVSARFARFVSAKSRHWATGNYLLDFEDPDRAYGGMFQTLLIASEQTGLPNVFMFIAEQYSLGHSRTFALYLKTEGLYAAYNDELRKISKLGKSLKQIPKVLELLMNLNVSMRFPENVHLELILKIDNKAVLLYYSNQASFTNWTQTVRHMSSLYMEFSINYQSLGFPLIISTTKATDLGTPALVKIRAASLMSARGSISQENEGKVRNAELDFRYSWNGVTTLRAYSPFTNKWYGADRCRNIHIRLPFTTQLILQEEKSVYKVKAVRHREFVTGTRLGLVWHSSTRYVEKNPVLKVYKNIRDEWTMDSEDLGVRLGASVFDCSNPDTLPEALHLLKKAFMANHKNYNMIPGGVVLLGILALKDQLQFQPQGVSCGLMLYFTPMLTQVEPELIIEGSGNWKLSMTRPDGLLWEIQAGTKRSLGDNKEFVFKLYRAPSVRVTVAHIWRVIQLEGAFMVPSRMSGISDRATSLTGYAFMSWGDASPSNADKAAMIDLKLLPRHNESTDRFCNRFTPNCLQAASDLAARQTAILQYNNLPVWLKTAAHALFPEEFQTESSQTQITFAYPVALLPWNTKGLCAVNSGSVLTLDNATIPYQLTDCYTLAVADCSNQARFAIQVKKSHHIMAAKVICDGDIVELMSNNNVSSYAHVNGKVVENIKQGYQQIGSDKNQLSVRERSEGLLEVELSSGVMLYMYNTTVVILVPAMYRGTTCGLCGDFNSDTINEPVSAHTDCRSATSFQPLASTEPTS